MPANDQMDNKRISKRIFLYLPTEMLSPWPKPTFPIGEAIAPPTPSPIPKPPIYIQEIF
jgi:hypothetical protein